MTGNLLGIVFGEMASNCYKEILAKRIKDTELVMARSMAVRHPHFTMQTTELISFCIVNCYCCELLLVCY